MGRRIPEVLNIDEFNLILKQLKKHHHRLGVKLGFLCGLRVSEIIKLLPSDIDKGRGMIFIRQAKGKKDRIVPIPSPLSHDLKHLPMSCGIRALQIAFHNAVKKAGITKEVTFHTLRHSAASYYLSKGMSIKEVQNLLGHSRISTTEIYLHANPEDIQNRMKEIWK